MQNISLAKTPTISDDKITKEEAIKANLKNIELLSEIQNKLYAQQIYSVLIVLQGMDASGKDSAVKNVFSGVNPAGCSVKSFKVPSAVEQAHHFLWRISFECPERGMIKIFNRSHYEDILVPVVNGWITKNEAKDRMEEINMFEKGLIRNNTILLKFYLNVSEEEQWKRLDERKTDAYKRWKYQTEDEKAIKQHEEFARVYETIFEECSEAAPWHLIPADKKWYKNYAILKKIVEELGKYPIDFPKIKEPKD
jgi:PPK2 family polyphosphate:nucleotide phosphotransferase